MHKEGPTTGHLDTGYFGFPPRLEVNAEMGSKVEGATGRVKTLEMSEPRISWAEIQTRAFPNWKQ